MTDILEQLQIEAKRTPVWRTLFEAAANEILENRRKIELYEDFHNEVGNAAHKTTITQTDNAIEQLESKVWELEKWTN